MTFVVVLPPALSDSMHESFWIAGNNRRVVMKR